MAAADGAVPAARPGLGHDRGGRPGGDRQVVTITSPKALWAHLFTTSPESWPHRGRGSAWVGMKGQPVRPPRQCGSGCSGPPPPEEPGEQLGGCAVPGPGWAWPPPSPCIAGGRRVRQQSITPSRPDLGSGGERAEDLAECLELGASGVLAPGTPVAAEAVAAGRGDRRSPSTSSPVRLAHPGLAAGVDVALAAAAAELVGCPRTEASRRSGTGVAATGRGVEPDVLPTAGGRLADRPRTFTPPAPGDLSGGHGDRRRDRTHRDLNEDEGAPRSAPVSQTIVCDTGLIDRLRPRLEDRRLPVAGPCSADAKPGSRPRLGRPPRPRPARPMPDGISRAMPAQGPAQGPASSTRVAGNGN